VRHGPGADVRVSWQAGDVWILPEDGNAADGRTGGPGRAGGLAGE